SPDYREVKNQRKHEQKHLAAECLDLHVFTGISRKKIQAGNQLDQYSCICPGTQILCHLRNGLLAKAETSQTQVQQRDSPDQQRESADVNRLDDRKHPDPARNRIDRNCFWKSLQHEVREEHLSQPYVAALPKQLAHRTDRRRYVAERAAPEPHA